MKIKLILNTKAIGLRVGNIGIGLMAFPWIYVFGNRSKHSVSFWEWLICKPKIMYGTGAIKLVQLRFMWFAMQVTT